MRATKELYTTHNNYFYCDKHLKEMADLAKKMDITFGINDYTGREMCKLCLADKIKRMKNETRNSIC